MGRFGETLIQSAREAEAIARGDWRLPVRSRLRRSTWPPSASGSICPRIVSPAGLACPPRPCATGSRTTTAGSDRDRLLRVIDHAPDGRSRAGRRPLPAIARLTFACAPPDSPTAMLGCAAGSERPWRKARHPRRDDEQETPTKRPKAASGMRKGLNRLWPIRISRCSCARPSSRRAGFSDDALDRPINESPTPRRTTNPCHGNVRAHRRGGEARRDAVGRPALRLPHVSIHESFSNPTSMFLRNLMAMDTEEMVRAQPMDAVVLIGAATRPCGPAHGRGLGRPCRRSSSSPAPCWSAITKGESARRLHRLPPPLGHAPRTARSTRRRSRRCRTRLAPDRRHLHGSWVQPRPWAASSKPSAWPCPHRHEPRDPCRPHPRGGSLRPRGGEARRLGRKPAGRDDPGLAAQCHGGAAGHRRLDQCRGCTWPPSRAASASPGTSTNSTGSAARCRCCSTSSPAGSKTT